MEPASLRQGRRAFTLLELILVLALLAILAVLVYGGYAAMAQSASVTTGAGLLRDILTEGRANAVARNTTVEVRIYTLPPQPGAPPVYSAFQLHWLKADGTTPPVAALSTLPGWVVIDATAARSPLVAANGQTAAPDPADPHLDGATRVFHFLPDGSTDLDPSINWFLTVRPANQSDPARFPADWASVSVDATTGRVQIYRP